MEQMTNHGTGWVRMEFLVPSRGLIGFRTEFLTETRGTGIAHHVFEDYEPWFGAITTRTSGSLVSDRTGVVTAYAMVNLQERGTLFVEPDHRGLRGHDRRRELPRRRHGRQHHQGEEAHQRARPPPTTSRRSSRRARSPRAVAGVLPRGRVRRGDPRGASASARSSSTRPCAPAPPPGRGRAEPWWAGRHNGGTPPEPTRASRRSRRRRRRPGLVADPRGRRPRGGPGRRRGVRPRRPAHGRPREGHAHLGRR